MSHLVEQMAYTGQTPWHGLGNSLSEDQPLEIWAEQAGMNWNILQTPVRYMTGNTPYLGETRPFEDKNVLYRSDTLEALSVVSQRYKVVQPEEILEFYRDLTEKSGFQLETAGVLKGGRKLWALANTGQSSTLKGGDTSKGYVLLATACDGSMATTAQFTSVRVVCNNTLSVALSRGKEAIKVPHSTRFDAQAVKQQLGISVTAWEGFMYQMKQLSERKINNRDAHRFIETVFTNPAKENGKPNERAMVKVQALYNGNGMGSQLESANGTAFGLLNSVTEFVDHQRRARSNGHRLDSAWFGQGASLKQRAHEQALLMIA